MGSDTLEVIGRILTIITGTTVCVGLGVKYILLPWLEKNLVKPVQEVTSQVTPNDDDDSHFKLADNVEDIGDKVASLGETVHRIALDAAHIGAATGLIQKMWDHHLEWSTEEVRRIWAAIEKLDTTKKDIHDDT